MIQKILISICGIMTIATVFAISSNHPNLSELRDKKLVDLLPQEIFTITEPELDCLAMNIYHEARNDLMAGQFAVADVVLNRVLDERFPDNICDVIHQGPVRERHRTAETPDPDDAEFIPVLHQCQFSWYCDGISDETKEQGAWKQAQAVAYMLISRDTMRGITEGATHYHATYVNPKWAPTLYPIGQIGKHRFYKWL